MAQKISFDFAPLMLYVAIIHYTYPLLHLAMVWFSKTVLLQPVLNIYRQVNNWFNIQQEAGQIKLLTASVFCVTDSSDWANSAFCILWKIEKQFIWMRGIKLTTDYLLCSFWLGHETTGAIRLLSPFFHK